MAATHAELAARLLRDAAAFFNTLGNQNPPLRDQMRENAFVFQQVADLVEADPTGTLSDAEEDEGPIDDLRKEFPDPESFPD